LEELGEPPPMHSIAKYPTRRARMPEMGGEVKKERIVRGSAPPPVHPLYPDL
jgi:hypothetical protein